MSEEESPVHPLKPLWRLAYYDFASGQVREALDRLEPVLQDDPAARSPSFDAGLLWGLAGDCYFKLGQSEAGFAAYRMSISLDPKAGCLTPFACRVARDQRAGDAALALQCLDAARSAEKEFFRQHPAFYLLTFLCFGFWPPILYHRLVEVPLARRRLTRLAAT